MDFGPAVNGHKAVLSLPSVLIIFGNFWFSPAFIWCLSDTDFSIPLNLKQLWREYLKSVFRYESGCGSGSSDPYRWQTDPVPDLALFVSNLQDANKKFLCLLLFDGTFILFFKEKKSQNSRNQGFSSFFCLLIEGSLQINYGFGTGTWRPKNIRIRNSA